MLLNFHQRKMYFGGLSSKLKPKPNLKLYAFNQPLEDEMHYEQISWTSHWRLSSNVSMDILGFFILSQGRLISYLSNFSKQLNQIVSP